MGGVTSSWVISRGVVGDPAPGKTQSWDAVRSDVPRSPRSRRGQAARWRQGCCCSFFLRRRPSAGPGACRSSEGVQPWRGGMGAGVGLLLLAQLLVRVELVMQGELRPELGVTGVGWGAWRPRGARLLASPQGCRIRTSCFQVRRPGPALPCPGHHGQDAEGAMSFHLSPAPVSRTCCG